MILFFHFPLLVYVTVLSPSGLLTLQNLPELLKAFIPAPWDRTEPQLNILPSEQLLQCSLPCWEGKFCNHLEHFHFVQGKDFVQGHILLIQNLMLLLAMVLASLIFDLLFNGRGVSQRNINVLSDCDCWAAAVLSFSLVGALPGFEAVVCSVICSVAVKLVRPKGGRTCDHCDEIQLWKERTPPPHLLPSRCSSFPRVWEGC